MTKVDKTGTERDDAALLLTLALNARMTRAQEPGHQGTMLKTQLFSLNHVPAVLAKSAGLFQASLEDGTLSFSLSYSSMSSTVVQAHIHFGASRTNGGVIVFLWGGPKPACPSSGTVTGTITAADVSLLPATNADSVIPQGITTGDFARLADAIRTGNAYVNLHTTSFPNGEHRGQIAVF